MDTGQTLIPLWNTWAGRTPPFSLYMLCLCPPQFPDKHGTPPPHHNTPTRHCWFWCAATTIRTPGSYILKRGIWFHEPHPGLIQAWRQQTTLAWTDTLSMLLEQNQVLLTTHSIHTFLYGSQSIPVMPSLPPTLPPSLAILSPPHTNLPHYALCHHHHRISGFLLLPCSLPFHCTLISLHLLAVHLR